MMIYPDINLVKTFKWKDLHKKVGQIIVQEPTDSDLQEGLFVTLILFIDKDRNYYLLDEFKGEK